MTHTRIRRSIVLVAGILAFVAVSASASTAIWGGTTDYMGYYVDPASGATLPAPGGILTFGASPSPQGGSVLVTTLLNLWKVPVLTAGSPEFLGTYSTVGIIDLAFDAGNGTLYGIADFPWSSGLYTIDYNCFDFFCRPTPLGVGMPGVQGIALGPGGIYGAEIGGGLWLLDPKTLQLTFIGNTFVDGITDLAYDPLTHSLIAASVGMKCYPSPNHCGTESGMIWSIDPLTAQSVLLNGNAPPIYGLAELTPEPGSVVLFTTGAVGLLAVIRRRLVD